MAHRSPPLLHRQIIPAANIVDRPWKWWYKHIFYVHGAFHTVLHSFKSYDNLLQESKLNSILIMLLSLPLESTRRWKNNIAVAHTPRLATRNLAFQQVLSFGSGEIFKITETKSFQCTRHEANNVWDKSTNSGTAQSLLASKSCSTCRAAEICSTFTGSVTQLVVWRRGHHCPFCPCLF